MTTFDHATLALLAEALDKLDSGFSHLPDFTPKLDHAALRAVLLEAAERMADNYPYQHPLYAGQMLKPPHPVAPRVHNVLAPGAQKPPRSGGAGVEGGEIHPRAFLGERRDGEGEPAGAGVRDLGTGGGNEQEQGE